MATRPRRGAPPGQPGASALRMLAVVLLVALVGAAAWLGGRATATRPSEANARGPGPIATEAGVPVGYAHSEAGAAAAALNLLAALYGPGLDPEQQPRVIDVLAADGADDWITDHLADLGAHPLPEDFQGRVWRWSPVGYDLTAYRGDRAVVTVWGSTARTSQTGQSFTDNAALLTRTELVWEDGDWRISRVGAPQLPREGLADELETTGGVWHGPAT